MSVADGLEYILTDMMVHAGFGMSVSLLDYTKVAAFSSKKERVAEKQEILGAMNRVLNSQPGSVVDAGTQADAPAAGRMDVNSIQYAQNIAMLKDYFIHTKVFKEEDPNFFKGTVQYFKNWHKEERLNNSSAKAKWLTGLFFEVGLDSGMALANYSAKAVESGLTNSHPYSFGAEMAKNIWEIPAFVVGLYAGKVVKNVVYKPFVETGEERKLNRAITQAEKKTGIVDIVFNYVPPARVAANLTDKEQKGFGSDINFTGYGRRIMSIIGKPKDYIRTRAAERKANYEAQREELRQRFNDITKNH